MNTNLMSCAGTVALVATFSFPSTPSALASVDNSIAARTHEEFAASLSRSTKREIRDILATPSSSDRNENRDRCDVLRRPSKGGACPITPFEPRSLLHGSATRCVS
jgi:hypothetical protein